MPGVTTTEDDAAAKLDVNGKANTEAILAAVTAGTIADAPAAQYCAGVTFVNGQQGYLPAAGELQAWYDNKTAVDVCMDAIGGDQGLTKYPWSSTQNTDDYAWYLESTGILSRNANSYTKNVRPVIAFEYN